MIEKAPGYWAQGKTANPIGICVHDTGSPTSSDPSYLIKLLTSGLTQSGGKKLPPPIYSYLITGDNRIVQIADDRVKTNHAGRVVKTVLNRMRLKQPVQPAPKQRGTAFGNKLLIGVALQRTGAHIVDNEQLDNLIWLLTTICERWGFDPNTQIVAHAELTSRKIDPQRLNMVWLRQRIAAEVKVGTPVPQPAPVMQILQRGVVSESVGKIQDVLMFLKFLEPVGKHRGHYGPKTEKAVKKYQIANDIYPTGIVDEITWNKLKEVDIKKPLTALEKKTIWSDTEVEVLKAIIAERLKHET